MILKQKAFQELVQMMKLKENQEKKVSHPGIELACITKLSVHGAEQSNAEISRLPSHWYHGAL